MFLSCLSVYLSIYLSAFLSVQVCAPIYRCRYMYIYIDIPVYYILHASVSSFLYRHLYACACMIVFVLESRCSEVAHLSKIQAKRVCALTREWLLCSDLMTISTFRLTESLDP